MSFFLYENSLSALTNVSVDGRGGGVGRSDRGQENVLFWEYRGKNVIHV